MNDSTKTAASLAIVPLSYFLLSVPIWQSVLLGITISLVFWYVGDETTRNLPPGPRQFPIIGNFGALFTSDFNEYSYEVHKKHGPIAQLRFGNYIIFSVGDYSAMKELGVRPDLQLRPKNDILRQTSDGLGIVSSEGSLWKHQRRFVLHALKDCGMGQLRMQEKIHDEMEKVFEIMEKTKGGPLRIRRLLEKAGANIIFALAFNKQYDYDDEGFIGRINSLNSNFRLFEETAIYESFPLLRVYGKRLRNRISENNKVMESESLQLINEHKNNLDPNDPRDLLDLFLIEMNRSAEDGTEDSEYLKTFFEEQLVNLIIDLFAAGTATSSTTICWALLYMIHHPDIQEKVRQEIDDVVGTGRYPKMEDRPNLPYTIATLQEIERLGSVAATSAPRSSEKPVKYRGYVIPEQAEILFSLYTIHRDPKLWDEPRKFNPSRFIDADGKVFRPPYLVPFGSGKRSCVGETLAKMEIFLFFAMLVQNFVIEAPDRGNPPSIEAMDGQLIRCPTDYELVCRRRDF